MGEQYRKRVTALYTGVDPLDLAMRVVDAEGQRDRYRFAWLSARRRAADEANFGMEALELRDAEIARLKATLADLRKSTCGAPELEHVGTDEDGAVYRLKRS
ncbi:hypothetical protein ACIQUY_04870 [Streptomyces sp. NPDC090231]|uniref:hypothetical protein n=1 Tax=unclassified Streptomyces TaxID=2593676 RepID=UPI003827E1AC